jgi:hypothetical protein
MFRRGVFTFLSVLLIAAPAWAASYADKCEAAKLKEAGKYHYCRMKAESKAVKKGKAPDYSKCVDKYSNRWVQIESKGGQACPTSGDWDGVADEIFRQTSVLAMGLSGAGLPLDPNAWQAFPASGQTTTYTTDKNDGIPGAVDVPDDGNIQAGGALSYVDNGDGTITDLNTGLMWEKKSSDGGLHDSENRYYWSGDGSQETIWDWLDDINAEGGSGFAGYSDWRIPNVKEQQSIVDYGRYYNALDPAFDTGCVPGCTVTTCSCTAASDEWSSTTRVDWPDYVWAVDFSRGNVNSSPKGSNHVRAVRGGL